MIVNANTHKRLYWTTITRWLFAAATYLLASLPMSATACVINPEDNVVSGRVLRSEDGMPIAGATVRVVGTKRGTYTATDGSFRLRVPAAGAKLLARSVGCKDDSVQVASGQASVTFRLRTSAAMMNSVIVQAPITADEVMRRAIARKDSNAAKIKTLVTELYYKRVLRVHRGFVGSIDTIPEIEEHIATLHERNDATPRRLYRIVARDFTRNVRIDDGLNAYSAEDLRQDTVWFDRFTPLLSPLAREALSYYRYTLVDRMAYGDVTVYVIDFEPRIRISSALEGRLHIVDDSYEVMYQRTRLTSETFIPFLDSAVLEQHYEEVSDHVWLPVKSHFHVVHTVAMLAGLYHLRHAEEHSVEAAAFRINEDPDDSMFLVHSAKDGKRRNSIVNQGFWSSANKLPGKKLEVFIAPSADSSRRINYDSLGVTPLTTEEEGLKVLADGKPLSPTARNVDVYKLHQDMSEQERRYEEQQRQLRSIESSPFTLYSVRLGESLFSVQPYLGRTTITGYLTGLALQADVHTLRFRAEGVVGETRALFGRLGAWWTVAVSESGRIELGGAVLSTVRTVQNDPPSLHAEINTGNLLFGLQRDYFVASGYQVGMTYRNGPLTASVEHENLMQMSRPRWKEVSFPEPPVASGRFALGHLRMSFTDPSTMTLVDGYQPLPVTGALGFTAGKRQDQGTPFALATATISTRVTTATLGSRPMHLRMAMRGAIASADVPAQYLFYSTPRFTALGDFADLLTIPLNGFGGDRQMQFVAEHNMSDAWWRALGLPLIRRRGVDLIVSYAASRFLQRAASPLSGVVPASAGWYQEAGLGLDAIPTFVMDHLYLRVDVRWPIGPLRHQGSPFGWSIGVTSPLFREL